MTLPRPLPVGDACPRPRTRPLSSEDRHAWSRRLPLGAARTPIGGLAGALAARTAPELGAVAIRAAVERAGVTPEAVEQVIMGNVVGAGLGQAPARQAGLGAGIPRSHGALTVNKVCGSGLKAVHPGAQAIALGDAEVVVAGGMESMSNVPYYLPRAAHRRPAWATSR